MSMQINGVHVSNSSSIHNFDFNSQFKYFYLLIIFSEFYNYKWYIWNLIHASTDVKLAPMCAGGWFLDDDMENPTGYGFTSRQKLFTENARTSGSATNPVKYHTREVAFTCPFFNDLLYCVITLYKL